MKTYLIIFLSLVTLTLMTGCYSQLATDSDYGNWSRAEDDNSDNEAAITEMDSMAIDEYASEYEESYVDSEGNVTNYYFYGYPSYRKYFWDYYPAVSIGIGAGWYYDPWYWYSWYPSYWYYPTPYCYYPSYWYPNYYYSGYYDPYPYYDNGYNDYDYKYRTNDGYKIRNNSGIRNTSGGRDLYASNDLNSSLRGQLKTREKQIVSGRDDINLTRTGLKEQGRDINNRNTVTRSLDKVNERTNETLRNTKVTKNSRMNDVLKRNETKTNKTKEVGRDTRKKTNNMRITDPKKTNTDRKTPNVNRNSNTNTNKSPNRNYTPPKSNNTPRSYSPPRNNTSSPPRGNTNSNPPRNSGSNNSGRR